MADGRDVLCAAEEDVGYRESANRRNKFGAWYGVNGVAWCMQAVQYWYAKAGAALPCKTASCGELLRWYRAHQPECIGKKPVPGCIVIFDFPGTKYTTDHAGIFESETAETITSIDGNTGGANDANGGYVRRRTRAKAYANPTYIVPRELEETMKRYDTVKEIETDAPWAVKTVKKLIERGALLGGGRGLGLSEDMLRLLVVNDRMGLYE